MKADNHIITIILVILVAISGLTHQVIANERTFDEEEPLTAITDQANDTRIVVKKNDLQDNNSGWKEAYIECLNNFHEESYGKNWSEIKEYYKFSLIDITGNGIPELILITEMQWLPSAVIYFDGENAYDYQRRYVQSIYFCPGQGVVGMEWFVDGRTYDDIYSFKGSDFQILKQGCHGPYDSNGEPLPQEEFYWCEDPVFIVGSGESIETVQITEEEYKDLKNSFVDESQAIVVSWDTCEYSSEDELIDALDAANSEIQVGDKYRPYKKIALKSKSTGHYVCCDIGEKKGKGKYKSFDDPTIHARSTQIQWYEMFNLVPCSDGTYVLQADCNRQYLKKDYFGFWWKGLKCEDDFIELRNKLYIDTKSKYTTIQFVETGSYVTLEGDTLKWDDDKNKAELFEIIEIDDNAYDSEEKTVLTSSEWFDLDGKGVGYWDIQDEIGRASTVSLMNLDYTPMTIDGGYRRVIEKSIMQCAVGVKHFDDGTYEILITFQGTGGINFNPGEDVLDGLKSIEGISFSKKRWHQGYTTMVEYFESLEGQLVAKIDGEIVTYEELLEKAKEGQARFMILGHSMGGAMAQIYAMKLVSRGVPSWQISGRTFNPALGVAPREYCPVFDDWYNICVTTDSVTNGLVAGSIVRYGLFRIGKTIWLYDDTPDQVLDKNDFNIAGSKHNMDQKLKEILSYYAEP